MKPLPPVSLSGLLRNWWAWTMDYGYVSYWQVRGAVFRSNPNRYRDGPLAPVLLLPGIWESWQFLQPLATALHERGHPVHVVPELGRNLASVVDGSELAYRYLHDYDLRGVIIIAHSKGGLIGKFMMAKRDPARSRRIERMIAVATPFSGSVYARWAITPSIRAFSPRDATLRLLADDLATNARITSIFPAFDPHIPGGSALPGARNVRLKGSGHFRIIGTTELRDALLAALAEEPVDPAPTPGTDTEANTSDPMP